MQRVTFAGLKAGEFLLRQWEFAGAVLPSA